MRYVVASMVFLVTSLFGIIANLYVFKLKNECMENKEADIFLKNIDTATTLIDNIRKISCKQWVGMVVVAVFMSYVALQLYGVGMPWVDLLRYISVASVLYSLAVIDWKTYKIPNVFVFGLFGFGSVLLVIEILLCQENMLFLAIEKLSGLFICVVLFYFLSRITKDGIGMGDVKIIAIIGWMMGFSFTILMVMFSLLICSLVACFLLVVKKKNKNDKIPFGPFLFLGYIGLLILIII